jgi:hypothetical protein
MTKQEFADATKKICKYKTTFRKKNGDIRIMEFNSGSIDFEETNAIVIDSELLQIIRFRYDSIMSLQEL